MPLLTAQQLAVELQMNAIELYRKAQAGVIPSYKLGKSRRFDLAEVLAAMREEGLPCRGRRAVRRL